MPKLVHQAFTTAPGPLSPLLVATAAPAAVRAAALPAPLAIPLAVPTLLSPPTQRNSVSIVNPSDGFLVYIGNNPSINASDGYPLYPGNSLNLMGHNGAVYVFSPSGGTVSLVAT